MRKQKLRDWLIAFNMKINVGRTLDGDWHASPHFNYMGDIPESERASFGSVHILDREDAGSYGTGTGFGKTLDGTFKAIAARLSGKFLRIPIGSSTRTYLTLPIPELTYEPGEVEDLY